ncbi:hypothetical protein C6500_03525 [Candidatus Poribacteria bacterium]|nr:MAG: hypothetical protein C6500_03525 [Candidatus Poribacteria bacterium]
MILRNFLYFPLPLLAVGILCWSTPIFAHDAFYPHHREDFESMTRRRELRGTVILSTTVFLCVLGTIIYIALRKIKDADDIDESEAQTVQERLVNAANRAAHAAKYVLNTEGNIAKAAETALTTYAETFGVMWQSPSYGRSRTESVPYQIRCKIGTDIVTLNINTEVVQLKAEHNFSKSGVGSQGTPKGVNVVLRIADEEKEKSVSCEE